MKLLSLCSALSDSCVKQRRLASNCPVAFYACCFSPTVVPSPVCSCLMRMCAPTCVPCAMLSLPGLLAALIVATSLLLLPISYIWLRRQRSARYKTNSVLRRLGYKQTGGDPNFVLSKKGECTLTCLRTHFTSSISVYIGGARYIVSSSAVMLSTVSYRNSSWFVTTGFSRYRVGDLEPNGPAKGGDVMGTHTYRSPSDSPGTLRCATPLFHNEKHFQYVSNKTHPLDSTRA